MGRETMSNLGTCKTCKKSVAWDAKTCPHCGQGKPSHTPFYRRPLIVMLGLFSSVVLYSCGSMFADISKTSKAREAAEIAAIAAKTPEQLAAEEAKVREDVKAPTRVLAGAKAIVSVAHDPKSIEWESAFVVESTKAVCYELRAKNGFGALRKYSAVLARDGVTMKSETDKGFIPLWNKECASGKPGTQAVAYVRAMVRQ